MDNDRCAAMAAFSLMRRTRWRATIALLAIISSSSHYTYAVDTKERKTRPHEAVSDYAERLAAAMDVKADGTDVEEYDSDSVFNTLRRQLMERVFSKAFNIQCPRDAINGVSSAMSNLLNTLDSFVSVAFFYPFERWQLKGWQGVLIDTPVALVSSVLVATAGVTASIYQIAMGIAMTPKAIAASAEGKVWDEKNADYVVYSMDQELAEVDRLLASQGEFPKGGDKSPQLRRASQNRVKDASYYNMLKVPSDADSSDIKRAYRREARNVHPDQHRNDPEAQEKFNRLHFVYETLMDDEMREAYDENGAVCYEQGAQSQVQVKPNVDPQVFFAIMFGSNLVEPYVGQLAIASFVDSTFDLTEEGQDFLYGNKQLPNTLQQKRRELTIAINLRRRVSDFVNGKQTLESFRASCQLEAEAIAKGDFGDVFLALIGSALKSEAKKFLGHKNSPFGLVGAAFTVENKVRDTLLDFTMYREKRSIDSSVRAYQKDHKKKTIEEKSEKDSTDNENCKTKSGVNIDISKESSKLFRHGLSINERDITSTLRGSCDKLFYDNFDPERSRMQAQAIQILGYEFYSVGRNSSTTKEKSHSDETINERALDAFMSSLIS